MPSGKFLKWKGLWQAALAFKQVENPVPSESTKRHQIKIKVKKTWKSQSFNQLKSLLKLKKEKAYYF